MLKEHTNRWLQIIKESGIDIKRLNFQEGRTGILTIRLNDSPLMFLIKPTTDSFDDFFITYSQYQPSYPLTSPLDVFEQASEDDFPDDVTSADQVDGELSSWLENTVQRYINEEGLPDFWSKVQELSFPPGSPGSSSIPEEDLQPFSRTEKQKITEGLQEFKRLVAEQIDPLKVQLDRLNERVDYLIDRLDKLNRFDWKAQTFSTLVSIAVNLTVDKQTGNQLYNLFQQSLGFIRGLLPPGLHI